MLRWVILVVAVVSMTAAATLVVQYLPDPEDTSKVPAVIPPGPHPKVVIDQDLIYEFGKMAHHEQGSHTWLITNDGEADLEIWIVGKPTCSCTIAKLEGGKTATIKPGVSTTIDLEWNTKEMPRITRRGRRSGPTTPACRRSCCPSRGRSIRRSSSTRRR